MMFADVLWLLFEIGINLFQGFSVTWFLDRVLTKKETASRWSFIACALCFTACCTAYLFFPMPNNDNWLFIIPLIYTHFSCKNSFMQKLFWVIISYLCISGVSDFLTWTMETFFHIDLAVLTSNSVSRIIFVLTGNLLIFIFYLIIPKTVRNRLERPLPLALFVSIVFLLVLVSDAQFAIFDAKSLNAEFLSQFSGALVLVITVLTVILYLIMSNYAREASEKKLLEEKIQQEMQRLNDLSHVSDSLHALRHDLLNHLKIASNLMQKGNPAESRQYLRDIEAHILPIFSTGCPALDSALYLKQQEMQHRGIILQPLIEPFHTLPVTAYELCTIVSNLLDNAMEAADRFPERPENYTVQFCIHRQNKMLHIECGNPVWEPSLRMKDEHFLSSKPGEHHGRGLPTVEKILDRMNAYRTFEVKNGEFRVFIILNYLDEIDVNLSHDEAAKKYESALLAYARENTRWMRMRRRFLLWLRGRHT